MLLFNQWVKHIMVLLFFVASFKSNECRSMPMNNAYTAFHDPLFQNISGKLFYSRIPSSVQIHLPACPLLPGRETSYFSVKRIPGCKKIFLAGDFNNYNPNSVAMKHEGNE